MRQTEIATLSIDIDDSSIETNANDSPTAIDSDYENTTPRKKKKKYQHIFNPNWTKQFTWLKNIKSDSKLGKAFCVLCNKTLSGNLFHIKRHEYNSTHIKNTNAQKLTQDISNLSTTSNKKNLIIQRKELELKMIAFVTEHNLPISIMDHLPNFIKSVCYNSKLIQDIHCGRTKANIILRDIFRKENIMELANQIKHNYFSLIIDETTDIAVQKSLVVCARIVATHTNDFSVKDHFLTLIELENSTAECLTDNIIIFLNSIEVPMQNMIGFAADNASVMMGNISGVQARLKKVVPHLFVLGCTCHSFHLCSSAACMQLPRSVEQFIRDVYNFFSNSSKRYSELKEFQTFLNIKPNKMLRPCQTRWLSLHSAVKKILLNWEALKLFFQGIVLNDKLQSTENILVALRNPVYKLYFLFLDLFWIW